MNREYQLLIQVRGEFGAPDIGFSEGHGTCADVETLLIVNIAIGKKGFFFKSRYLRKVQTPVANAKTEQAVLRKLHKFILRSQGSLSSLALTVYLY